jgi:hypothetical protein
VSCVNEKTMEEEATSIAEQHENVPNVKRARDEPLGAPPAAQRRFILERGSEPVLGLLGTLGFPRHEALEALAARARSQLVEAITSMPPPRLRKLLLASFPHIDTPRLHVVAAAALAHAPELPTEIVTMLIGPKRELLEQLPLRVRQRVWATEEPPTLFLQATHALIIALQEEGAQQLARVALREAAEIPPKRRRAESGPLQELVALVGSRPLYVALTQLCADIFRNNSDPTVAGLRTDLTMALHEAADADRPVARWDLLHTFICCVDAALRERRLESRAAHILLSHLTAAGLPVLPESGAAGPSSATAPLPAVFEAYVGNAATPHAVLLELAMILSQSPVQQLLAESTLARLEAVVDQGTLPGTDAQLRGLIPLLTLAHKAPAFSRAGHVPPAEKWRALLTLMLHKVLPVVAELIADDRIAEESSKLEEGPSRKRLGKVTAAIDGLSKSGGSGGGGVQSILEMPEGPGGSVASAPLLHEIRRRRHAAPALPASLEVMLEKGHGRALVLLYVLRRVEAADEERVEQLLPLITRKVGLDLQHHDDFAGGLVSALIADPARRLTPRIARAAISGCLVPLSSQLAQLHTQLLRLLQSQWRLLMRIPALDVADQPASTASMADAVASDGEAPLTLLQMAARQARASGALVDTEECREANKNLYSRLERSVPELFAATPLVAPLPRPAAPGRDHVGVDVGDTLK